VVVSDAKAKALAYLEAKAKSESKDKNRKQRQNAGLSTARRTMKLSAASVEMTNVCDSEKEERATRMAGGGYTFPSFAVRLRRMGHPAHSENLRNCYRDQV
jgi:hypothetical protein